MQSYNEGFAVVKSNESWKLYDVDAKRYIDKDKFDHIGIFKGGYSLCLRNNNYLLIDKNGNEYNFSQSKNIRRSGNTFWTTDGGLLKIYSKNNLVSSIPLTAPISDANSFNVIEDSYIDIGRYNMKYSLYTRYAMYNIDGTKLEKAEIEQLDKKIASKKSEKINQVKPISIKDTSWEIKGKGLYYKDELKYTAPINVENHEFLEVSDFFSRIATVDIIWDVDPEFGVRSEEVGYIDMNGNYYWKD